MKQYLSSSAFRMALEERIVNWSNQKNIQGDVIRRKISFERFLARVFYAESSQFVLKGGYAMELRILQARATRDIDLSFISESSSEDLMMTLQDLADIDLKDYFEFKLRASKQPFDELMQGGNRFHVESFLDGRIFSKFHIDVGLKDAFPKSTIKISGEAWLEFAGIPSGQYVMISKEQQFAEKIHAYTKSRGDRINSRVKDLIDFMLLLEIEPEMKQKNIKYFLEKTFEEQMTHEIPQTLPPPPETWKERFEALAKECGLNIEVNEAFQRLALYWEQIMGNSKLK